MSSEKTASAVNILKGDLAAGWNLLEGSSADYTDLGVARRFGGAAAAYSLRDIGAMNGRVVNVRREPHDDDDPGVDDETDFSANQVQSGVLEDWVNGKLEDTLPADVATAAAAYSLRRVSEGSLHYTSDFSSNTDTIISNTSNLTLTGNIDGISDGTTSKDNVLKVENDATKTPQLAITNADYVASSDGIVEFTYYVPTGHPIIGSFWHIGTGSGIPNNYYTDNGVKIVGGTWTTAKLFFGSTHNGVDKPTTTETSGRRMLTIANNIKASSVTETVQADDGDIYYISALTFKETIDNAVRIRRSSDNVEVDVAFDSDDKVSASSAITNIAEQGGESGSTTATDLNGFLNESNVNVGMGTNFFAQYPQADITGTSPTGFTATVAKTTTQDVDIRAGNQVYKNVQKGTITVSFNVQQNTFSNTVSVSLWQLVHGDGYKVIGTIPAGSTGAFSFTFENTDAISGAIFRFSTPDHLVNDGEVLQVSDITIKASKHTALVHTWYDQAGSNNAVQATDANQPKIASSGALLADGLEFDGDFLQTSSQVLTGTHTGANSMYVVVKQTSADNGYICGSTGSGGAGSRVGQSLFSSNTNDLVVLTDGTDGATDGTLDNIARLEGVEYLISANYSNNNTNTLKKNANDSGYANGTDAYTFSAGSTFSIGTFGNSTVSGNLFAGSMKEIIVYASDQSANRFKIESNINNYYGLYNDANAFSANAQVDGTGSTVSNASKDGGTLTLSSASGNNYLYFQLTETVPATSGDVFVSFNYESSNESVTLNNAKLRDDSDSAKSGDLVDSSGSSITIQKNGFYSGKLASANLTSTGTRLAFLTNQTTDGYTFTISNLRYSRIARNGFVETWYDQSGNANNASQATASQQPELVVNGGIAKNSGGLPSPRFSRVSNVGLELDFSGVNVDNTSVYVVNEQNRNFSNALVAIMSGIHRVRFGRHFDSSDGNIRKVELEIANSGDIQHLYGTTNLGTQPAYGLYLAYLKGGGTSKVGFNSVTATSTSLTLDGTYTWNRIFRGDSNSTVRRINHMIPELIIYSGDKLVDTEIADNIKDYYNI